MAKLTEKYKWPKEKPGKPKLEGKHHQGWFSEDSKEVLSKYLSEKTKVVVELGSWMGKSTRFILEHAPNATVFAVDHWEGSPEHEERFSKKNLEALYSIFLIKCWDYRKRLVPMKTTTSRGLIEIWQDGIEPELIFVDAGHDYISVMLDVFLSNKLFPKAKIIGDDWPWGKHRPVKEAVNYCAEKFGLAVSVTGGTWEYLAPPHN